LDSRAASPARKALVGADRQKSRDIRHGRWTGNRCPTQRAIAPEVEIVTSVTAQ
jgi:hypothetical protein